MSPEDIQFIRQGLPETLAFPYYPDRESPWLLATMLRAPAPVAELRTGPAGRLLGRPLVRPVVAACGGLLHPADVAAVAEAYRDPDAAGAAGQAGLQAAYAADWSDFEISLAEWGVGRQQWWAQVSRPGGNLVVQLGFPSDHATLMGRYLYGAGRKLFEYEEHPIRQTGRPTLAWARLDIDMDAGVALIEEVQSDWLRFAGEEIAYLARHCPRSRQLRQLQVYEAGLKERYGRIWPRAMLLAVLILLRNELGCREVWMHQPGPGAALKGISGALPPRSIYTALPRHFGFRAVREVPAFLERPARRKLRRLRKGAGPLFWKLAL
ncbi:MAG: hypothetical protein QNJ44_19415 [Rhodobacter sp.]|nr:hypothetical protein [Rhodobacter sp.]